MWNRVFGKPVKLSAKKSKIAKRNTSSLGFQVYFYKLYFLKTVEPMVGVLNINNKKIAVGNVAEDIIWHSRSFSLVHFVFYKWWMRNGSWKSFSVISINKRK